MEKKRRLHGSVDIQASAVVHILLLAVVMSTLVDSVLNSNSPGVNGAGLAGSDDHSMQSHRRPRQPSSSRPGGPPSESHGHQSDDGGFADDEVVGLRGNVPNRPRQLMDRAVPRVVDVTGETVQQNFEEFLEQYEIASSSLSTHAGC